MAHPKFTEVCRYCQKKGLKWSNNFGQWRLIERNRKTGSTRVHVCPQAPGYNPDRRTSGKIGSPPVPGKEYPTSAQIKEYQEAEFIERMERRLDPGTWAEYEALNVWPMEIEGITITEDDTPQWIV